MSDGVAVESDVIVVDEDDNFIRNAPREEVHASTQWHRTTISFLFNGKGELLLSLRSKLKDKFPLHWESTIAEHVDPGESYEEAIRRGLEEEIGVTSLKLKKLAKLRVNCGPNDNEIMGMFTGEIEEVPAINHDEIEEVRFVPIEEIKKGIDDEKYAPWFRDIFKYYVGMESVVEVLE